MMQRHNTQDLFLVGALIALPLLIIGATPTPCFAGDPIFLDCKYDEAMEGRRVVITLDLEAKSIRWEDFYKSGIDEVTYTIISSSDSEIKGRRIPDTPWPQEITINRINGRWLVEFLIDRSINPELWDAKKGVFPHPPGVRIKASIGGSCSVTKPKF